VLLKGPPLRLGLVEVDIVVWLWKMNALATLREERKRDLGVRVVQLGSLSFERVLQRGLVDLCIGVALFVLLDRNCC
jgi:hypothetical protein